MNKFWAWWALIFYILPVMIAIPLIRRRRRGVNAILIGVAIKYGGEIKSIVGIPYYVGFDLNGLPVSLSLSHSSRNSPAQTSVAADIPQPVSYSLRIVPECSLATLGKKLGLQDIKLMQPEFDSKFLIQGSEDSLIRHLLNHDIQALMLKWHAQQATLHVKDNKFRMTVYEMIQDEERLDEFIADADVLLSRIREIG